MNWMSRRTHIAIISVVLLVPGISAGSRKEHKYRYSDIDMPISLSLGTVRTPEFPVIGEWYFIMIQGEKGHLPFFNMRCMMGLKNGTLDSEDCKQEPLLQADWKVWDGERIVSEGSSSGWGAAEYTDKYLFKFLGKFAGEAGKKYAVEVKFTRDGTPLNVANPHLIVILVRNH